MAAWAARKRAPSCSTRSTCPCRRRRSSGLRRSTASYAAGEEWQVNADETAPAAQAPTPPERTHRGRGWLIAGLVVVGILAALGIGYLLGDNSRDDDVKSAQASAAKANAQNEQNAQNTQAAADEVQQGVDDLGTAISQQ